MCIAVEAGLELSIRCVFHGAGASRRNCDAQKAYCFQHGLNCNDEMNNVDIQEKISCVFFPYVIDY